uniref:Uncharacterized protein n=1 Tax=Vibrio parahaemolyticus TaxID=670 RepID=A0A7M1VZZ6_VIBPH|nr:hypothetical protein VP303_00023 [Vibrio parahaemolyticus]
MHHASLFVCLRSSELCHSGEPKRHQESTHHMCHTQSKVTKNALHQNKEPNRTSDYSHSIPSNQRTLFTYPALKI